jgi:hypothetical protein
VPNHFLAAFDRRVLAARKGRELLDALLECGRRVVGFEAAQSVPHMLVGL